MKKIFCIVAAVIITFVISLLSVLGFVKKSLAFSFNQPYYINVFNKSATTPNKESYYADDKEYTQVISLLKKTTTSSLLNLLLKTGSVQYNIEYGGDNYKIYDTSIKTEYLVVEVCYKQEQNVVVYEGKNTRVISFVCLLFVIQPEDKFSDIIIYNSQTSDTTQKDIKYKENKPFVIKGNPKKLISYVNTL